MPLITLLIDVLTLGGYFLQLNTGGSTFYLMGLIFQGIMTVLLLFILISYHGKKLTRFRPAGYLYLTVRYAVILISFLINAIVLFLYGLNYFGINDGVFTNF